MSPRSAGWTWRRFRRAWLADNGRSYEPPESGVEVPFRIWASRRRPTRIIYFTKDTLLLQWIRSNVWLPAQWLVVERRGFPEAAYLGRFADIAGAARAPACVVGDLDPLDLSTFLALRALSQDIARPPALRATWCGISDPWLRLCRRHLRAGRRSLPLLDMRPLEKEHWQALVEVAPDLEAMLGPESMSLLHAGKTLALEGASGAGLYSGGFADRLLAHIVRSARRSL